MPKKDTDVRKVRIDVEVHRAIEAGRVKFDESENAILRRLLGIDARPSVPRSAVRPPRSSGAYSILMGETPVEANSLKELLRRALLLSEKRQPGLLDRLAAMPTSRGRYLVARDPAALYPRSPQLAGYAEPLTQAGGTTPMSAVARSPVTSRCWRAS